MTSIWPVDDRVNQTDYWTWERPQQSWRYPIAHCCAHLECLQLSEQWALYLNIKAVDGGMRSFPLSTWTFFKLMINKFKSPSLVEHDTSCDVSDARAMLDVTNKPQNHWILHHHSPCCQHQPEYTRRTGFRRGASCPLELVIYTAPIVCTYGTLCSLLENSPTRLVEGAHWMPISRSCIRNKWVNPIQSVSKLYLSRHKKQNLEIPQWENIWGAADSILSPLVGGVQSDGGGRSVHCTGPTCLQFLRKLFSFGLKPPK